MYTVIFINTSSPQFSDLTPADPLINNRIAFSILEKHYNIPQLIKPSEMAKPDRLALFTYLSSVYETFQELESPQKAKASTPEKKKNPLTRRISRKSSKTLLQASPATESWNTHTSSLRRSLSPRKSIKKDKKLNQMVEVHVHASPSLMEVKEETAASILRKKVNSHNSQQKTKKLDSETSGESVKLTDKKVFIII